MNYQFVELDIENSTWAIRLLIECILSQQWTNLNY